MSKNIEIIETRKEHTVRYGTILYSNVKDKGWTFQYDTVLTMFDFNEDDEDNGLCVSRSLPADAVETGEFIPYLEDTDNEDFYTTFEEAQQAMYSEMSNLYHMGCIAGFR